MGVASVISDYAPSLPPLLLAQGGEGVGNSSSSQNSKYLQLGGSPWRGEAEGAERLQVRRGGREVTGEVRGQYYI